MLYFDIYDKRSKQIYDTVNQLMKLAENDDCDGFLALAKKNEALLNTMLFMFEVTVTAGLMTRNKTDILDKFIEEITPNRAYLSFDILCHLAGLLIRKRRCREAVKLFILKSPEKPTTNYTLLSAVMMDDLEFFKLLYNFETDYSISLLFAGIFKSKKILDHITGCGSDLLKNNMPCKVDFNEFIDNEGLFFIEEDEDLFSDESFCFLDDAEDVLIKWLKNIHSMYLNNEVSEKSYKIMSQIAKNTNIDTDYKSITYPSLNSFKTYKTVMRKIFLMNMYELKTNDLTPFILLYMCGASDYVINEIIKIAGDAPFVTYCENHSMMNIDFIAMIAKQLDNTLIVKLINNFDMHDIYLLRDKVRIEIDADDPRTAKYLINKLSMPDTSSFAFSQNDAKFFIDKGLITVEKMTELAALAQNHKILNMLFNYKNKKKRTEKKQKGA